jgi:O-antigen ligase
MIGAAAESVTSRADSRAHLCGLGLMLALAFTIGGASRDAFAFHLAVNAAAFALLAWRLIDPHWGALPDAARLPLAGYGAFVLIALLQLIPLPPAIWSSLPGRAGIVDGYALTDLPLPWLPISLTPASTFEALLGLLPPIAVFVAASSISWRDRHALLALTVGGAAAASVFLGIAQVLTGKDSALYLYEITNSGLPVGFFANVNHQAIFLLMCAPLLAVQTGRLVQARESTANETGAAACAGLFLIVLGFGVAMAGSVAGWLLATPVLLFCAASFARRLPNWFRPVVVSATGVAALAMGVVVMSSPLLADKGVGLNANSRGGETRLETAAPTIEAIQDSFPLGTGPGSFEAVFPGYEDPADVRPIFMNHAHNDWLELVLEAGLAGMLLAAGGVVWFIVQLLRVWTPGAGGIRRLQRVASISLGVLLLHSVVDYPLRTPAVACVAALLLALLAARDTETAVESSREGTSLNPAAI